LFLEAYTQLLFKNEVNRYDMNGEEGILKARLNELDLEGTAPRSFQYKGDEASFVPEYMVAINDIDKTNESFKKLKYMKKKDDNCSSMKDSFSDSNGEPYRIGRKISLESNVKKDTKFKGVYKVGANFDVYVRKNSTEEFLGTYKSEELAARAHDITLIKNQSSLKPLDKKGLNYPYTDEELDSIKKGTLSLHQYGPIEEKRPEPYDPLGQVGEQIGISSGNSSLSKNSIAAKDGAGQPGNKKPRFSSQPETFSTPQGTQMPSQSATATQQFGNYPAPTTVSSLLASKGQSQQDMNMYNSSTNMSSNYNGYNPLIPQNNVPTVGQQMRTNNYPNMNQGTAYNNYPNNMMNTTNNAQGFSNLVYSYSYPGQTNTRGQVGGQVGGNMNTNNYYNAYGAPTQANAQGMYNTGGYAQSSNYPNYTTYNNSTAASSYSNNSNNTNDNSNNPSKNYNIANRYQKWKSLAQVEDWNLSQKYKKKIDSCKSEYV